MSACVSVGICMNSIITVKDTKLSYVVYLTQLMCRQSEIHSVQWTTELFVTICLMMINRNVLAASLYVNNKRKKWLVVYNNFVLDSCFRFWSWEHCCRGTWFSRLRRSQPLNDLFNRLRYFTWRIHARISSFWRKWCRKCQDWLSLWQWSSSANLYRYSVWQNSVIFYR